jgi:hypothetical protein
MLKRTLTEVARAFLSVVAAFGLIGLGALGIAYALQKALPLPTPQDAIVVATAQPVLVECTPPTEFELLLIAVTVDERGKLHAGCKYVIGSQRGRRMR